VTTVDRLARVRGFIIDLDGTTYLGERALPGARTFLEHLGAVGLPYLFVTNNSSTSAAAYVDKLRRLDLPAADGQVLTSGEATAMFLQSRGYRTLYVVGTPALEDDMRSAGFTLSADAPECVVLGFDRTLTYAKLEIATRLLNRGLPFVATHPDVVCPTETGYIPDCGAMIALLRAATGVEPTIVGKPEPLLVEMALRKLELTAPEVAVIGDRLYTDIAMARRADTLGILVLSGETTHEMVQQAVERPDIVVDHLGGLLAALRASTPLAGRAAVEKH
jgi:HAD superfamily hydrolase (TIGR01457 family)